MPERRIVRTARVRVIGWDPAARRTAAFIPDNSEAEFVFFLQDILRNGRCPFHLILTMYIV